MTDQNNHNTEKIASELAIIRLEKELRILEDKKAHPVWAILFFGLSGIPLIAILYIILNINSFGFDRVGNADRIGAICLFLGLIAIFYFCIKGARSFLTIGNKKSLLEQKKRIVQDLKHHRFIVANK